MYQYLITYDLNTPGQNYPKIHDGIRQLAPHSARNIMGSVWIIQHSGKASQIKKSLDRYLDYNDKLLVTQLTLDTALTNIHL